MCSSVAKTWPSKMKPTTTTNLGKLGLYTQSTVPLLRLEKMAQEAKIPSLGLGLAKELQAHMELKTKVEQYSMKPVKEMTSDEPVGTAWRATMVIDSTITVRTNHGTNRRITGLKPPHPCRCTTHHLAIHRSARKATRYTAQDRQREVLPNYENRTVYRSADGSSMGKQYARNNGLSNSTPKCGDK
jgi:hypothetical protein